MTAPNELEGRTSALPVDSQFLDRWSPRSFTSVPLTQAELDTLFEAARWAPSASNEQPWLFLYADTEAELARFRPLLEEGNRLWADKAPVLMFLFSRRHNSRGAENRWAPFDAGAAWMSLALQAGKLGLHAHAMAGFLEDQVYEVLKVDRAEWQVMAAVAVGHRGDRSLLPEKLAAREQPNARKPLSEIARRGPLG